MIGKARLRGKFMATKTYNKLVRDLIPDIILKSGKTCRTRILTDEEYLKSLDAKLDEELAEYHRDGSIEELADLLELIQASAIARGYTLENLETVRFEKANERGGFENKVFLIDVTEQN